MENLPHDIVYNIMKFNHTYRSRLNIINKDCNKIFSKKEFINQANKIQQWYILRSYSKTYDQLFEGNWSNIPKRAIVKYYRKYYPTEYLMRYPEFMARKLHRMDLQDYINEQISPIETRRKIEVINFFNLPEVSTNDIIITGW
jgi:hypothetical protein